MTAANKKYLVIGLGVTGMSVVRYLAGRGCLFEVAESNAEKLAALLKCEPSLQDVINHASSVTADLLKQFDCVVVSPGISVRSSEFVAARASGVEVIGDVELFAREVNKPVLAVTGSNGKSTVVSMAGALLKAADINAEVVGNVGVACLDSLADQSIDAYVLELSSFQLETTQSLKPVVATVLNICEDHLDRYEGIEDYAQVKRSIYKQAKHVVFNADDDLTVPANLLEYETTASFAFASGDWSVSQDSMLGRVDVVELAASNIKVAGVHNQLNALAAMAMVSILIDADAAELKKIFTTGFANFTGLPHRTRLVCESDNVSWINDSKGTNVGATVSAIKGMAAPVVLIAGGRGKNADYQPLKEVVAKFCTSVVLIGEEALKIKQAIGDVVPMYQEDSMAAAVNRAAQLSKAGDCVLLSPACSSFDMFKNFEDRGNAFEEEVKKLCA